MVQLQKDLPAIKATGLQVVGISYDEPKVLKAFADASKIDFTLLSDPESKTIDAYHVRNAAGKGQFDGIPHPGTFVVDRQGVVRAKLFLKGYAKRHTTDELVAAAKKLD